MRRRDLILGSILVATGAITHIGCNPQPTSTAIIETIPAPVEGNTLGLPLFSLGAPDDSLPVPGKLVWEGPHEKAKGAFQRKYAIPQGHVTLTTWQGKLQEVVYHAPAENDQASVTRNAALFEHYGEGHAFNEVLDNGFGMSYQRADKQRYALWGYTGDFITIGTMDFHAVKWR